VKQTEEPLSIRPADLDDINTIGFLAQQIWPVTYSGIVADEHWRYMLNHFYNPASLRRQMIDEHQQFLILEQGEEAIGFASWSPTKETGVFKLHKLYVLPDQQGKGLGRMILQYIYSDIRPAGGRKLRLNVNRFNKARQFYERLGFVVIGEEDVPVGNDVFMNDYIMEAAVV